LKGRNDLKGSTKAADLNLKEKGADLRPGKMYAAFIRKKGRFLPLLARGITETPQLNKSKSFSEKKKRKDCIMGEIPPGRKDIFPQKKEGGERALGSSIRGTWPRKKKERTFY